MIIAVDFDGTLCEHRFPDIGGEVVDAFKYLREFQSLGAKLMLWTMRSDLIAAATSIEGHKADRAYLTEAVEWCRKRGVEFWGVNSNPGQGSWTLSPKQYAHLYIDDAAFGCPLRDFPRAGSRKVADWTVIGPAVIAMLKSGGASLAMLRHTAP